MSRIGKKPIALPGQVKVELSASRIKVGGPKGTLEWPIPAGMTVQHDATAREIRVIRGSDDKRDRAMHGTTRAIIQNMVTGVSAGYERTLEVYGTGYGVKIEGRNLVLTVGFAHTVLLPIPPGVEVKVEVAATRGNEAPAKFTVSGPNKQVVGQFARAIKDVRPPEPYQGKGIRYAGEVIKRKQGKAFAGSTGA